MGSKPSKVIDVVAVLAVLLGTPTVVVGLVGIILIWSSKTWDKRDKIIGSLIPVELVSVFVLLVLSSGGSECSSLKACSNSGPSMGGILLLTLMGVLMVVAIASSVHMILRVFKGSMHR
ncbi:MAG: hypothetical protein ACHQT9_00755 [Candidatus Saccharimonadales bacterium]